MILVPQDIKNASFEPKMENRFVIEFGEPISIPSYVVCRADRPSFYMSGWNDMLFSVYDPVASSVSKIILDGLNQLRKQENQNIDVTIKELSPVGDIVQIWEITGEVTYVDFGTWDWKSDEPVKISIRFKVKNVKIK